MRLGRSIVWGVVLGLTGCLSFIALQPQFRPIFSLEYWQSVHRFATVLRLMKAEHVNTGEWQVEEVTNVGIQAMLQAADPYSGLMTGKFYEEFINTRTQSYVGIGIEVTFRNGKVTVLAPFDGGSAQEAGVFPGDQIMQINGEDIEDWGFQKVISSLRGEIGTKVEITVFRAATGELLELELERRPIAVTTVKTREWLADGIGYLRISRFSDKTDHEFMEQLNLLKEQGLSGLVVDLRNNPGGILSVCLNLIGNFFPQDATLLRIVAPAKKRDFPILNELDGTRPDFRIAILIDGASASAAEIMTAALQEAGMARVFGEPSFGKATVQSVLQLGDEEALRLTTAKYLTAGGMDIAGKGVEPDVRTGATAEDTAQIYLQEYMSNHLSAEQFKERFGLEWKEDVTLVAALAWLKGEEHDSGN